MNYIYGLAALCVLLLGVEQYGEHRVNVKWDLERARLVTIAVQAAATDKAANKAVEDQHKKDIENAKSKAGRAAVAAWVKSHGLLPSGPQMPNPGCGQTDGTGGPDDPAGQSGVGERIAEFAEGCALDALKVLNWQEWAIREGLEVK